MRKAIWRGLSPQTKGALLLLLFLFITYQFFSSGTPSRSVVTSFIESKRFLLANLHRGVENEFVGAIMQTGQHSVNFTRLEPLHGYNVTAEFAQQWWQDNSHLCSGEYDAILVGDTTPLSRPFLQGHCKIPIIIIITNRYDHAVKWDPTYHALMQESCQRPNVFCAANNWMESVYASRVQKVGLHIREYLPSGGFTSATTELFFANRKIKLPPADDSVLYVSGSGSNYKSFKIRLDKYQINLPILPARGYGGPLALKDRLVIHVPYQSNTMAFFENLAQGVIYVVPSLRLFRLWIPRFCGQYMKDYTDQDMRTLVDWYRDDFSGFFFYFDDLEDLRPGSAFTRECIEKAPEKRRKLKEYMVTHQQIVLEKWKKLMEWIDTEQYEGALWENGPPE